MRIRPKLREFSTERLLEMLRETSAKETVNWSERKTYVVTDDTIVKSSERDEMVAFLLEVCERQDMSLSIETFSLFVHLLDRFLSSYKVKSKYLECLAVACLYVACKVKEEDENIAVTAEFLAECECKCSIGELLRMEQMILAKFEWNVNDTTAIDFVHIYHALLVNEYRRAVGAFNKPSREKRDTCEVPPILDILPRIEYRLKQCLCISELAGRYRPQLMAYTLVSLEVERLSHEMCMLPVEASAALVSALDAARSIGKLGYESLDKCRYEVIENTRELDLFFDNNNNNKSTAAAANNMNMEHDNDEEIMSWTRLTQQQQHYHQLPPTHHHYHHRALYGVSPLVYTGLDVIEEVDENDEQQAECVAAATGASEHQSYSSSSSASSLALSSVSSVTYADVLLGRAKKRRHDMDLDDDDDDDSLISQLHHI